MTSNAPLRDPVVALVAAIFLFGMIASGLVGVMFGALMLGALATYIFWCYREERAAAPALVHNAPHDRSLALELSDSALHGSKDESWLKIILLTIAGLATLVVGGKLLVSGAITLATLAGLSEAFIGLTIVAIGTSLPELATSLIAARKGESDVAFGNIIGSNIYNILGIGGATMLIMPEAIDAGFLTLDVPLMTASAALICFLAFFRRTIGRFWGAALLLGYFAYLGLLVSNI
jgi:cation:H+ antiporter